LLKQKDDFTGGTLTSSQEQIYTNDNIRKNTFCFTGGADLKIDNLAKGNVAIKKDKKNNNYQIHLQLSYLGELDRLTPPKNTYVVWMVSDESDLPVNLGQVVGTSKLKVKFETVTA